MFNCSHFFFQFCFESAQNKLAFYPHVPSFYFITWIWPFLFLSPVFIDVFIATWKPWDYQIGRPFARSGHMMLASLMPRRKLHTKTFKAKQLVPVHLYLPLICFGSRYFGRKFHLLILELSSHFIQNFMFPWHRKLKGMVVIILGYCCFYEQNFSAVILTIVQLEASL